MRCGSKPFLQRTVKYIHPKQFAFNLAFTSPPSYYEELAVEANKTVELYQKSLSQSHT